MNTFVFQQRFLLLTKSLTLSNGQKIVIQRSAHQELPCGPIRCRCARIAAGLQMV